MIVIDRNSGEIGRVLGTSRELVQFELADRQHLVQFGIWRWTGETVCRPRLNCRLILTEDAAERVVRDEVLG